MKWEYVTQLSFTCTVGDIPTVIAQIAEEFGNEIKILAFGNEELAPNANNYEYISIVTSQYEHILIDYYLKDEPETLIINQ